MTMAQRCHRQGMVTVRRNDARQPREGARMTYAERSLLRRMRRGRMALIQALLDRGVDARQIAELARL